MKAGSVIVDLAAERGGNSWITKNVGKNADIKAIGDEGKSMYKGIINLGYKDWASRMPQ